VGEEPGLRGAAAEVGADIGTFTVDGGGWRWRVTWRGVRLGAWNDMDGVAISADIGPWDEWIGLQGHPPDPDPVEALRWAVETIGPWLDDPEHAERIAKRTST
jgi:hypothetical protein